MPPCTLAPLPRQPAARRAPAPFLPCTIETPLPARQPAVFLVPCLAPLLRAVRPLRARRRPRSVHTTARTRVSRPLPLSRHPARKPPPLKHALPKRTPCAYSTPTMPPATRTPPHAAHPPAQARPHLPRSTHAFVRRHRSRTPPPPRAPSPDPAPCSMHCVESRRRWARLHQPANQPTRPTPNASTHPAQPSLPLQRAGPNCPPCRGALTGTDPPAPTLPLPMPTGALAARPGSLGPVSLTRKSEPGGRSARAPPRAPPQPRPGLPTPAARLAPV